MNLQLKYFYMYILYIYISGLLRVSNVVKMN